MDLTHCRIPVKLTIDDFDLPNDSKDLTGIVISIRMSVALYPISPVHSLVKQRMLYRYTLNCYDNTIKAPYSLLISTTPLIFITKTQP